MDSMVLDLEFGLRVVQCVEEGSSFSLPVNEKKKFLKNSKNTQMCFMFFFFFKYN